LLALGRNDEALKLTKQAKTILTAGPSPSLHLATASSVLAVQYASRHELGKAVNEYRQAIAICDETGTPLAQTLKLQIKYGLANVLKQNNKREEARQHLDEIIHAREIDIANHNNETAAAEAILACYLEKAASYTDPLSSEREECFQQMTNLYREGAPLSQLQAAMLAQAHFYLADIKSTKAKTYSVAESDLLKSEQFWAKAAGPNPASAATYDHLSRLEKARGNLNKAREYLHKALDIYKATVGPNDPSYKASKAALANLQSN